MEVFDDLYVLDEHGNPQRCEDLLAWGDWMKQNRLNRYLARDYVGDGDKRVCISTIFLGVSMNINDEGLPVLFETMVFGGVLDTTIWRYTSRADAMRGHRDMCRRVNLKGQS